MRLRSRSLAGVSETSTGDRTTGDRRRGKYDARAGCRTDSDREVSYARAGGHLYRCDACGGEHVVYNGCRSRHCPSCLSQRSAEWLEAQEADLLPVAYFHVVFTVQKELGELALGNKKVIYALLFRAVSETLRELGRERNAMLVIGERCQYPWLDRGIAYTVEA